MGEIGVTPPFVSSSTIPGNTVMICENSACRLVFPQPDALSLLIWPKSDKRCPRCGTPWKAWPDWKGPPPMEMGEMDGY